MARTQCKRCQALFEVTDSEKARGIIVCKGCGASFRVKKQIQAEPVVGRQTPLATPLVPELSNDSSVFDDLPEVSSVNYVANVNHSFHAGQPAPQASSSKVKMRSSNGTSKVLKYCAAAFGIIIGLTITRVLIPSLFRTAPGERQSSSLGTISELSNENQSSSDPSNILKDNSGECHITNAESAPSIKTRIQQFQPPSLSFASLDDKQSDVESPILSNPAYQPLGIARAIAHQELTYWLPASISIRRSLNSSGQDKVTSFVLSDITRRFAITETSAHNADVDGTGNEASSQERRRQARLNREKSIPWEYRFWEQPAGRFNAMMGPGHSTIVDLMGGKILGTAPSLVQRKRFARLSPDGQSVLSLVPLALYLANEPDEPLWSHPTRSLLASPRPIPNDVKSYSNVQQSLLAATFLDAGRILVVGRLAAVPNQPQDRTYYLQILDASSGDELWRKPLENYLDDAGKSFLTSFDQFNKIQKKSFEQHSLGPSYGGLAIAMTPHHDLLALSIGRRILLLRTRQPDVVARIEISESLEQKTGSSNGLLTNFSRTMVIHDHGTKLSHLDQQQLLTWDLNNGQLLSQLPSPVDVAAPLSETAQSDELLIFAKFQEPSELKAVGSTKPTKSKNASSDRPWLDPDFPVEQPAVTVNWRTGQVLATKNLQSQLVVAYEPDSETEIWVDASDLNGQKTRRPTSLADFAISTIRENVFHGIAPNLREPAFRFAPLPSLLPFGAATNGEQLSWNRLSQSPDGSNKRVNQSVYWAKFRFDSEWKVNSLPVYEFNLADPIERNLGDAVWLSGKAFHPSGEWLAVASVVHPGTIDLFPWKEPSNDGRSQIETYSFRVSNGNGCDWLGWRDDKTLITRCGQVLAAWRIDNLENILEMQAKAPGNQPQLDTQFLWATRELFDGPSAISDSGEYLASAIKSGSRIDFDPATQRPAGEHHRISFYDLKTGVPVSTVDTDGTVEDLEFDSMQTMLLYSTRQSTDRVTFVRLEDGSQKQLIAEPDDVTPEHARTYLPLKRVAIGADQSLYLLSTPPAKLSFENGVAIETTQPMAKIGNRPAEILGHPLYGAVATTLDASIPKELQEISGLRQTPVSIHVKGLTNRACAATARAVLMQCRELQIPIGSGGYQIHGRLEYSDEGTVDVAQGYFVDGGRPPAPSVSVNWNVLDPSGQSIYGRTHQLRATHTIYDHIAPGERKWVNVQIAPEDWRKMQLELLDQVSRGQVPVEGAGLEDWYSSGTDNRALDPK